MSIDVKYTTSEEKRMIQGIQKAYNAVDNGIIGNQTLSEIAKDKCPEVFPLTLTIYGMPVIISKSIIPFDPNGGLKNWDWVVSGSYSYPDGQKPCSILVQDGKTICGFSAQAWLGYPDSVIYEKYDGTINICRVMYDSEIPDRKNVKWAIGGTGLLGNYSPQSEGYYRFVKDGVQRDYSGVFRKTNHIIFGVKDGFKYGIYVRNMGGGETINNFIKDKFKLDYALKLDGGHIAAIKAPGFDINTSQSQGYGIQFVGVK